MQIKIRKSTFETNSSSMHTLVLSKTKGYYTKEEFDKLLIDGYFPISSDYDRGFEREFRILDNLIEKIYYVLASLGYENLHTIISAIKLLEPDFKGFIINIDEEYGDLSPTPEKIDAEKRNTPYLSESYSSIREIFGDIDHQSVGMIRDSFNIIREAFPETYKNVSTIKLIYEILFNKLFVIVVDSDESNAFIDRLATDKDCSYKGLYDKMLIEHYVKTNSKSADCDGYEYIYEFASIDNEVNNWLKDTTDWDGDN